MSSTTAIEWTESTWNPTRGCDEVSPGCAHCYAKTFAERWRGVKGHPYEQGFDPQIAPHKLTDPLRWKRSRLIFVNSMSDLFHKDFSDAYIRKVFAIMSFAGQHTYQVLTKRAARLPTWFADHANSLSACQAELMAHPPYAIWPRGGLDSLRAINGAGDNRWPLPNVWLGVSVEDQKRADERIPHLLATPAAVRFLSIEPLLGPVNLSGFFGGEYATIEGSNPNYNFGIDWVIVGGESGPGARPCDIAWIRSIVDQSAAAGVPCFVKQLGGNVEANDGIDAMDYFPGDVTLREAKRPNARVILKDRKGGDPTEWPTFLKVREMPQTAEVAR